jgi:sugar lactone lactonase YvrE
MTAITSPVTIRRESSPARSGLLSGIPLNWETAAWIVILLLAIFTRFYILGDRVMSHDESLHTKFSHDLYLGNGFAHTPLMHGPILFHATALSYFLFGANDFAARIYPAVLGVIMTVLFPILFKRWLGTWGALLMAVMLLISPIWMYYNRYIREDTPNIFALFLMIYCFFMYLDGPRHLRRKARWLYICAAAMLWMFGSKETGFMYGGIFALFMLGYFAIRLYQHFSKRPSRTLFEGLVVGTLIGSVTALILYIVLSIAFQPYPTLEERASYIASSFANIFAGRGTSLEFAAFINWTLLTIVVFIGITIATMVYAYWTRGSFPLRELAVIILIAAAAALTLVYLEELSQPHARSDIAVTETTEVTGAEVLPPTRDLPVIVGTWIMAGAVIVATLYITGRGWWRTLYRFPELDIILLMATLILPWLTPVLLAATGNSPTDYSPAGIVRALALGIPLALISIVIGVTWNWKRWLIYAACFYIPFLFFFTTMFSNPNGVATGIVGSLGYWIEQQDVRRGSQPQYYYQLIVMPMYEFLPIIGSILAMFAGLVLFWQRRRHEQDTHALLKAEHAEADSLRAQADVLEAAQSAKAVDDAFALGVHDAQADALKRDANVLRLDEQMRRREFRLSRMSFVLFMAWLAVGSLLAFTLAGEKMPWLGTHMTVPMIVLTAWYFGRVFEKIEWAQFSKGGWMILVLIPLAIVAFFQSFGTLVTGVPVAGLTQDQLQRTGYWLATIAVGGASLFFVWRIAKATSGLHVRRMIGVGVFALLTVFTFRAAWSASMINYDYATEFLVYAHAAPGWTEMMTRLEDIEDRTADRQPIRFAWGGNAWPASWYFRDYPGSYFGMNPTPDQLRDVAAVYASADIRSRVEPLLEDRYVRFDYTRMWWPMQDYFNLNATRVLNALDLSPTNPQAAQIRQGIFDIWWSRDYRRYGEAVGGDYSITNWPVSETMHFYVRRDIAAQIWSLGVGDVDAVLNPQPETVNLCVANWSSVSADLVFTQPAGLPMNHPLDIAISEDGQVYVSDEFTNRVLVYNTDGVFQTEYTTASSPTGAFTRPNGLALSPGGMIVVADTWNFRVQILDREGLPVMGWGEALQFGSGAPPQPVAGFWGPRDVAVDGDGNIYVSDTGNKRVRVYDAVGNYLRDIGSGGMLSGQLDEPAGLAVSPDGRLFVADTWNNRISVFNLDGSPAYDFPVRGWYDDLGNRPYLALDNARNLLYVSDPDAGRVLVYDTQGNCLGSFGQPGDTALTPNQFQTTAGIAVDATGNVYVVDSGGNRVLRFPPFEAPPAPAEAQG